MNSILNILGIRGAKDTIVGDGLLRGVSGGQKRRVTLGETMVCQPQKVTMFDSISNGLDSATTYEIANTLRIVAEVFKMTGLVSLLQPPPEVFALFEEIIIMAEGHILYHGPRESILGYFADLGYCCPANVDIADFILELATPEAKRYAVKADAPLGIEALLAAWKKSDLYKQNIDRYRDDPYTVEDPYQWEDAEKTPYAAPFLFYAKLLFYRQISLTLGSAAFVKVCAFTDPLSTALLCLHCSICLSLGLSIYLCIILSMHYLIIYIYMCVTRCPQARIGQAIMLGALNASLYLALDVDDAQTMFAFLFAATLVGGLANLSMIPLIMDQKAVFYKQADASFFPTLPFVITQSLVLIPMQLIEQFLFCIITYWSVGE
jgi:hypothetical protein